MKFNNLLLFTFIALFTFSACEKDEDEETTPATTNTTNNNGGSGNNGGGSGNNGGGSNNTSATDSLAKMTNNVIQYRDTLTGKDTTISFGYYFAEDGKVFVHQKSNRFSKPTLMIHFTEGGMPYFPANDKTYTYRSTISGTRPPQGEWDFQFCPSGGVPNSTANCFTQDYIGTFTIDAEGTLYYQRSGDTFTLSFFDYQTGGYSFSGKIEFTNATVGDPNYDGSYITGTL